MHSILHGAAIPHAAHNGVWLELKCADLGAVREIVLRTGWPWQMTAGET